MIKYFLKQQNMGEFWQCKLSYLTCEEVPKEVNSKKWRKAEVGSYAFYMQKWRKAEVGSYAFYMQKKNKLTLW